jgi:hypothetical protein
MAQDAYRRSGVNVIGWTIDEGTGTLEPNEPSEEPDP